MENIAIEKTPTPLQLIDFKIAVIEFLKNINKPELSDLDQEVLSLWKCIIDSTSKTITTNVRLTEEQILYLARNYDCGRPEENQEWFLNREDLFMFVKDIEDAVKRKMKNVP